MCDEKTNVSEPLSEASIDGTMASKPRGRIALGTKARACGAPSARGWPACCPGGARCRGGVSLSQALAWNRRTSRFDAVRPFNWAQSPPAGEREYPKW